MTQPYVTIYTDGGARPRSCLRSSDNRCMWLREVAISKPRFDTYEDAMAYARARSNPQQYIDHFVHQLRGVRPSVRPEHDPFLERAGTSGSATIASYLGHGVERIRIGTGYYRDSELFKTIFHEEMHLRIRNYALRGRVHHLQIATTADNFFEENYVEAVAKRYYSLYINAFGPFEH